MTQAAQQLVEDTNIEAPRRLLQAVLVQAINDIEATILPSATDSTIARIEKHRKEAYDFFFGKDTRICDNYLILLGHNAKRFKADLKVALESRAAAKAAKLAV